MRGARTLGDKVGDVVFKTITGGLFVTTIITGGYVPSLSPRASSQPTPLYI